MSANTLSLRELAAALGGDTAGLQVLAPGPGHSRHDRSLAVRPSPDAPDGFLVKSFAGDDWRDCRDHVRSRLGLPTWEPGDDRHRQRTIPQSYIDKWDFAAIDAEAQDKRRSEDDLRAIGGAQELWSEARDPRVEIIKRYFESRGGLPLPDEFAGHVLRFHPRCPWRNENTGRTDRVPCLVAAFRSIDDDAVTGIHRIRLDQPERWPKTERRMLGIVHRAAIKLGPPKGRLSIAEGLETGLAVHKLNFGKLNFGSVWALGSVGAISWFPLVDEVMELVICAEAGAASDRAVRICGRRWRRAGRRVFVSRSTVGSDHNDFLMAQKTAALQERG